MASLVERMLMLHEGLRLKPYLDTADPPRTTIGYGRNLTDCGISKREAHDLLQHDLQRVERELAVALPWVRQLDAVRYACVVDLCYNMGLSTLLTFRRTLAALEAGQYARAAGLLLQSKYARQVQGRAKRIATMLATGSVPPELAA